MRLFENRDYRRLFSAQIIALFGTGLATVALGLLAYDLAGPSAGAVLGTALTIKMVMYVVIAPIAAAYVDRLPRRTLLTLLDAVRAVVVLALPFVTEVWHIYLLVGLLQAASAAFTPTFQAVIPDIVTEESAYVRALSASQVASTMESLLSPVLAAVALAFLSFDRLFLGTSAGFLLSALLVLSTRIPEARPSTHTRVWDRATAGIRTFLRTPRLRGIMALNLAVAAAGSIVVVNTVNYVRDELGGPQSAVAWMLATSGGGTLLAALALPRVLDRVATRTVMVTGAGVLVGGTVAAVTLARLTTWAGTAIVWALIGIGMALVITPTGKVLRASVEPNAIPGTFAAQFSLSHLAWLITYPIAGWLGTNVGFAAAWSALAALAGAGAIGALLLWPRHDGRGATTGARGTHPGRAPGGPVHPVQGRSNAPAGRCRAGRVVEPSNPRQTCPIHPDRSSQYPWGILLTRSEIPPSRIGDSDANPVRSSQPRRWTALVLIALAQFTVIMDTPHHWRGPPQDAGGPGLLPRRPVLGLQRLRRRLRRASPARRAALRPVRRQADLRRPGLDRDGRGIPHRRPRLRGLGRTDRARPAGRRRRADRPVRPDTPDDALRRPPQGADQGAGPVRRRGPGRRRRRLPRRCDHRVRQLALGVLHQHSDRPGRAGLHPGGHALSPVRRGSVDFGGAATVTVGLATAVYAIVRAPETGWGSAETWLVLLAGLALIGAFVAIQSKRREPLMRLGIWKSPNLAGANIAQLLMAAA